MVFSSVPPYLDPSNWHQQPNHHQPGTTTENPQLQEPPPQPSVGGASMGSIRPGSMADRARMAKLPQPESALKCPRCESTNTKFCYFNNYSLSQPRHFCKTCRRYWTRGGALRNVPVGGGCRRNKRSKGSRSKSPVTAERQKVLGTTNANSISANNPSNTFTTHDILAHHHHMQPHHQLPQLPFMTSLHHLTDHYGGGDHIGLNYSGIQPHIGGTGGGVAPEMDFQIGSNSGSSGAILSSASGGSDQQWRLQQFPFLGGLDHTQGGLYPIDQGDQGVEAPVGFSHQLRSTTKSTASLISQLASVKMEDNPSSGLNLSRQLLGIPIGGSSTADHQYWGGNAWATDLSSFSSSSTSPLL